ncbi:MAG: hypothetical protein AB7P04_11215, partial [Bacteriovoracia bacterium]
KETEYFVYDEKVTEQVFQRLARGGAAGFMAGGMNSSSSSAGPINGGGTELPPTPMPGEGEEGQGTVSGGGLPSTPSLPEVPAGGEF